MGFWVTGAVGACAPEVAPLPDARPGRVVGEALRFEPPRAADAVAASTWIVIETTEEGASGRLHLFQGRLSATDLGRIERQDLSSPLAARQVPVHTWSTDAEIFVAPLEMLEWGRGHSLVWEDGEVAGELTVEADAAPMLRRVWPPPERWGAAHAIFCGPTRLGDDPIQVPLPEYGLQAVVSDAGVALKMPDCMFVNVPVLPPIGRAIAMPPRILGASVPPTVLRVEAGEGATPSIAECELDEQPLLSACWRVYDDRVLVRSGGPASFWNVSSPDRSWNEVLMEGDSVVLKGLPARSTTTLSVRVFTLDGAETTATIDVATLPPTAHIVINEVMANPRGPEPSQEWIEIVNDGIQEVSLAGWRIEDGAGEGSTLPAQRLRPGQLAVLVQEDYEPDSDLDAIPPPGVPILRVPQLGKSGLSNSGELLRLRAGDGSVVSKFPANPKPEEGRSVARRHPHTPFQSLDGFGLHGPSDSSPGRHNELPGR